MNILLLVKDIYRYLAEDVALSKDTFSPSGRSARARVPYWTEALTGDPPPETWVQVHLPRPEWEDFKSCPPE